MNTDDIFIVNVESCSKQTLEALRDDPASTPTVVASIKRELSRRRTPRFTGPVLVTLNGDSLGRRYAFDSPIALACGDRVVVDTCKGRMHGVVVGHGTGSWNPHLHGPLRSVVRQEL